MDIQDSADASAAAPARRSTVQFSGRGAEFFGIWIVNILLTIVTLGIYSAWAKVRTTQYFYGHTKVDGHSFRYLATPIQILKGRIIAVAVFALISVLSTFSPFFGLMAALAFLIALPWILVQGMKFSLRMTSYRNVRFGFHGTYGSACIYYLLLPILSVFTLYLAMPWALKKLDQFIFSNISFGGKQLEVSTRTSTYYKAALTSFAVAVGLGIVCGIAAAVTGFAMPEPEAGFSMALFLLYVAFFGIFALAGAVYTAMIRNHLLNSTLLPETAELHSNLEAVDLVWVTTTNMLLVLCTLGLAYPWAKVRMTALLAAATEVTVYPAMDNLTDPLQQNSSVFAEQAADLFDVDLSLT
jgi:uncharacterized membrane protein YjgN (DUF898 family)